MKSTDMRVDVSDLLDGTSAFVEASLYAPASPGLVTELLVALHGAGYDRRYYDIDSEGYSFAEYFTARGYHVLAIDHLGMGRSTQPESEPLVTRTAVADANHRMVRHAQAQLSAGGAPVRVTCMAHSMGGMLGIVQQARHHSFERLAIAGWSNIGVRIDDGGITQARVAAARGYLPAPRRLMHDLFYLPDVPEAMIALDACCASLTPAGLGRDAMTPDAVAADAAQIRCPVLVLFGEVDTSPDPAAEVRYYASSPDITLVRLEGSAHIQHLASSRQRFWQRLESWLRAG